MIDFIEYVVAELKRKRLSRADALELIRQFSRKSPGTGRSEAPQVSLHPLLQANTSDLSRLGFSSVFTGEESFLADHRIRLEGQLARKVLPGAAYLEMARAAAERVFPAEEGAGILKLADIVWLHPLLVEEPTEVSLTLYADHPDGGEEGIGFEISSACREEDGQAVEKVHCQGRVARVDAPASARLDLDNLRSRMGRLHLEASRLYATYFKVGAEFGPTHRSLAEIHVGVAEVLAHLVLPAPAESLLDMPLHPSLLDGALQACIGMLPDPDAPGKAALPFALENLEVLGPCAPDLFAWIRYVPGSGPADRLAKVDIDLCDAGGTLCVRMRGFSSRSPGGLPAGESSGTLGLLLAAPTWKAIPAPASLAAAEFSSIHVLLFGFPDLDARALEASLPGSRCRGLPLPAWTDAAGLYSGAALEVFGLLRELMGSKSTGQALVQIAVAGTPEGNLLAGLEGLLKTARLENPQVTGQLLLVPPDLSVPDLAERLREGRRRPQDTLSSHLDGQRRVSVLAEIPEPPGPHPLAFKPGGVYLITGGLGGLGTVFARAILEACGDAEVILSGRSPLDYAKRARIVGLSPNHDRIGSRVSYRQADIAEPDQARLLVAGILEERGRLDGILHAAGIIQDGYILKKSPEEFLAVLAPKVAGTVHLDEATRDLDLDFLVLFSSGAAVTGNAGQSDYAAANGFMDRYADHRNKQVTQGKRRGKTLSINWPLWQEGGMGMDEAGRARARESAGMHPMQTSTGLRCFNRCLTLRHSQVLAVEGDLARLRRMLFAHPASAAGSDLPGPVPAQDPIPAAPAAVMEAGDIEAKALDYIKGQLAALLKAPAHRLDPEAPLEKYGIDSILAMSLTGQLEKAFGPLSKTLFFEYQTLRELAAYFVKAHGPRLAEILSAGSRPADARPASAAVSPVAAPAPRSLPKPGRPPRRAKPASGPSGAAAAGPRTAEPIAIIGLSGRYPEAQGIGDYWRNLREGKDCIVEIPAGRWDWREFYTPDRNRPGSHYSKWGGFIAGVDEFDPRFFNISPLEAELMDPQERLFLQHAWMAMEDAGYTRANLQVPDAGDQAGQVGVYAGVMYSEYQLFGSAAGPREKRLGIPGSYASIANRVSYLLNLHGPSLTLDSMCSSSLTAIHLACQDLKLGRTSMAIAGGVNVSIHPNKYLVISAGQFISGDGHCQSFGEGGEGYIPGEGIGVVMLKRLSDALRDGDHVYGIIRASAINHGGKTNGYSVPNPQAQAGAIARALSECGVDARHVSYVEAHGTGTKLGDPIEIAALTQAFRRYTEENGFCRIGSAKSNIGHAESAAGIAGLTKVLLQMRHGQFAPSLHSARLNPHIDFAKTPFVVNQELRPWDRPIIGGREIPRLAGLSSFGAGGSNAHLIIEEFVPTRELAAAIPATPGHGGVAILLSARTAEQLGQKIQDLLAFVRGEELPERDGVSLAALAYTLQTGREAMDERLGFVAASCEELERRLEACARGEGGEGLFRGRAEGDADTLALFHDDADLQQTLGKWIAQGKLEKLLGLWVKGLKLDWNRLYAGARPRRMSLPAYPFARERYWVDVPAARLKPGMAALHPLLHANVSDLTRQRYATVFTGAEPFLADHQVRLDGEARKVLPAAACLEMARAAVEKSLPHAEGLLELRDLSWSRPIVVGEETPISIELIPDSDGSLFISVLGRDGEDEIVHFEGKAAFVPVEMPAPLDLGALAAGMGNPALDSTRLYSAYARMGLEYGPTHRTVTEVLRGDGQVLARIRLSDTAADGLADFLLHPGLADGALQSALGLADPDNLPAQPAIPFALASLRVLAPCTQAMTAWVRRSEGAARGDALAPLDIDLCDGDGRICAQWRGLASRPLSRRDPRRDSAPEAGAEEGILMAIPTWESAPIPLPPDGPAAYARQVILIGMRIGAGRIGGLPAVALIIPGPEEGNGAALYRDSARKCFELVQRTLAARSDREALVQIVVADDGERTLCAGLTGLLRTASLEDPRLTGQLILCEPEVPAEELARRLTREALNPVAPMIRYLGGERQILAWRELPADPVQPASAYRQDGVYLITGGLGGLGLLFARDILARAPGARVVLTGRSELPESKRALLEEMSGGTQRLRYLPLDLADAERVSQAIASVAEEYGRLNGILHCAGMTADNLIARKSGEEFLRVLEPKVAGTCNLDTASRDLHLDFLALFSSAAGALGNPGQADYAAANGFLDQFAAWRNRLAASGQRHGHTLSLDWPLWREGGMGLNAEGRELLFRASGMRPMDTAAGLEAFHRALLSRPSQVLVLQGDLARLRALLHPDRWAAAPNFTTIVPVAPAGSAGAEAGLVTAAAEYLRDEFAQVLKLRPGEIDPKAPLEKYGIDSILAMRLTGKLEETFGALPKTLFFEYQNVAGLAAFFAGKYPALIRARSRFGSAGSGLAGTMAAAALPAVPAQGGKAAPRAGSRKARFLAGPESRDEIAIVGLGGRYPQAENLDRFWENLKAGKDCITEIPPERWDGGRYFDQSKGATGKSRSKWGGFLSDVDKFDPLFFNISPQEAELMDPQERLFLETAWETVEDAGYSKERLAVSRVGVYVGVMYGQYELFGSEAMARGDAYVPGSSFASIANRVSYLFDFRGPSLAVDTMCSSSLTAIYLACEEIRKGGIDAALAGGVNLSLHPQKYLLLSQGNFTASDGRCRSFGAGGDGYVPGEGVGAVLLKPLSKALADGDQVYGVIKAMALNHGGKTNGYTVPNPNAQADLIGETLRQSGIDPATVGYLEAHGTGTSLGDPIEIAGLMKAFAGGDDRRSRGICAIGSVKSNIGHLESAAGIASLTKALLQLKHRMLVPSLHAEPANPNIDFASTCFRVQTRLEPWESPSGQPRRIGISSFGAGGSNAHLILEECPEAQGREQASEGHPEACLLSAKGSEALRRYAMRLVGFLEQAPGISLARLAFTSQVGRTSLKDRLAVLASSREELADKLKRWLAAAPGAGALEAEGIFLGDARQARSEAGTLMEGEAGEAFIRALAENREVAKLAKLWATGSDVDWALLARRIRPQRVSLPTYPFTRERHWIEVSPPMPPAAAPAAALVVAKAAATAGTPSPARPVIPVVPSEAKVPSPVAGQPESPRRYAFRPRWREAAISTSEVTPLAGPVLLLGEDEALHRGLRAWAESESPGHPVIQVRWEPAYREINADIIALDPGNEKHFHRFAAWLKAGDRLPRVIVHHAMQSVGMDEAEGAGLQLDRGIYALFHLCKGLLKHRHQVPVRILSLQSEGPGVALPLHAALGGFLKTLAQENPKYQGKVVSLQGGPESPQARAEEMIRILRAELGEKSWTPREIQYRFHEPGAEPLRSVRELAPLLLEAARTGAGFKQKGVYLVSGGLGGLGLVFSAFLAERFQAKLVLFGRSATGAEQEKKLAHLRTLSPDVIYLRADVSRLEDMRAVVEAAKGAFGRIDGVIHSAGVNRDNFLFKKTREEMEGVIGPKVFGALNLDRATRGEDLDLFVLFSSLAGVLGNPGQCDYAYGNHFLDAFAECREQEKRQGRRSGKSLSISWPYWEAGGMTLSPANIEQARERIGLCPLPTEEGVRYWEDFLRAEAAHGIALYGIGSRIAAYAGLDMNQFPVTQEPAAAPEHPANAGAEEAAGAYLKALIGAEIKLDPDRIDARERFESFGIDSIVIARLNIALERDLGEIPKTLFYEYETVEELAEHLSREFPAALARRHGKVSAPASPVTPVASDVPEAAANEVALLSAPTQPSEEEDDRIAIIGMHGHYPGSQDLETFWENLKLGKDSIGPVPSERWDGKKLYDSDPEKAAEGKIYCKWGGFLADVDKFDPRFFNIPAEEAGMIDPQERIFLESVWAAVEDAGYTRAGLKRRHPKGKSADVGVFVGVTTNSYHLLGAEAWSRGNAVSPGSLPWSIANRVSYLFDFQGPSLPIDTACSSSLVAMHLACESLKRRECQVAIAGGVNLYLHPSKYLSFCQKRSLSPDGKCRSFGAGEEGFVPGEGVGTLVLKRLDRAVADGDRVLAVIAGSAYDHSGRSNGYSAPNPKSQAALIDQALRKARVSPESIGCVEGHGTATRMGDSLEVAALSQAFRKQTAKKQFCSLGSVKANIGHAESAAGIAGVAKALLQLRHRQLAPTLHSDPPNPDLALGESPFFLQRGLSPWEAAPGQPRRAMVNAFGAGGVNACVILEEFAATIPQPRPAVPRPRLFLLSARDEDRLRKLGGRLSAFLRAHPETDPDALAYTLQAGREAMAERAALVAAGVAELALQLEHWLGGKPVPALRRNGTRGGRNGASPSAQAAQVKAAWAAGNLEAVADAWLAGAEIDWESLHAADRPARLALPAYPFARERHWIPQAAEPLPAAAAGVLHPLLHSNASSLREIGFASQLSPEEFYARDHKVNRESLFPGSGYLELACVAGNIAGEQRVAKLQDVVWVHPLGFTDGARSLRTCLKAVGSFIEYRIVSVEGGREKVHSEGRMSMQTGGRARAQALSLAALKDLCPKRMTGEQCYQRFRQIGFDYGPSFQTLQEVHAGPAGALARLKLPDHLKPAFGAYILHPSLLDGALQTVIGLVDGAEPSTPYLPFAIDEVELLRPLSQTCHAWVEPAGAAKAEGSGLKKFDITLLNDGGDALVKLKGFYVRALAKAPVRRHAEAVV